jgi:hypothetical protein
MCGGCASSHHVADVPSPALAAAALHPSLVTSRVESPEGVSIGPEGFASTPPTGRRSPREPGSAGSSSVDTEQAAVWKSALNPAGSVYRAGHAAEYVDSSAQTRGVTSQRFMSGRAERLGVVARHRERGTRASPARKLVPAGEKTVGFQARPTPRCRGTSRCRDRR